MGTYQEKTDCIRIEGLVVFARHGIMQEERSLGQKFQISLEMECDIWKAAKSEKLKESINYAEVCRKVTEYEQSNPVALIETAAEDLARYLLWEYRNVMKGIRVTIEKPWAPIGLPLEAASVTLYRSWHDVYIGLGSNMGDRADYIRGAIRRLVELPDIQVLEVSELIETEPYGYTEQDKFLNACAHIRTTCQPEEFLDILQEIEREAKRERTIHWGPRTLDLDILFYDDCIIGTERLCIPHPGIEKRMFVLTPMCEIAPWLLHPVSKRSMAKLKEDLEREAQS